MLDALKKALTGDLTALNDHVNNVVAAVVTSPEELKAQQQAVVAQAVAETLTQAEADKKAAISRMRVQKELAFRMAVREVTAKTTAQTRTATQQAFLSAAQAQYDSKNAVQKNWAACWASNAPLNHQR